MSTRTKEKPKYLIEGNISPELISTQVQNHQKKTGIGAHTLFLGQVRADKIDQKRVIAIEYSAYAEMAEKEITNIREKTFEKYDISCLHIFHSIGKVKAGEISLLVMVSASHRPDAFPALQYVVEQIKHKVPVWKKELFEDGTYRWIEESLKIKNYNHA